jgi:hypothetical protein
MQMRTKLFLTIIWQYLDHSLPPLGLFLFNREQLGYVTKISFGVIAHHKSVALLIISLLPKKVQFRTNTTHMCRM